jgi:Pyruvate/2-oxoacid:ferredoxin oxidoreductase delta subunit
MAIREIITIDEEKCDGCGLCVPACAEGAIQIIDGVAKLVSETYCDGLGACLGECPQDAIRMEQREADEFDEVSVKAHLEKIKAGERKEPQVELKTETIFPACPGSLSRRLSVENQTEQPKRTGLATPTQSQLSNWPVQLHLVPIKAPYFDKARLMIAADCVPFAFADFHTTFLKGRTLLIGCPKLDDVKQYQTKLTQIFLQNDIHEVEIAFMEVPCCFGLVQIVKSAVEASGKDLPLILTKVGIKGGLEETQKVNINMRGAR